MRDRRRISQKYYCIRFFGEIRSHTPYTLDAQRSARKQPVTSRTAAYLPLWSLRLNSLKVPSGCREVHLISGAGWQTRATLGASSRIWRLDMVRCIAVQVRWISKRAWFLSFGTQRRRLHACFASCAGSTAAMPAARRARSAETAAGSHTLLCHHAHAAARSRRHMANVTAER